MSDIVTLDVGGRHYKTTAGTLRSSGSAYFHSLLERWMPSSTSDDEDYGDVINSPSSFGNKTVTPVQKRGESKKISSGIDDDGKNANNKSASGASTTNNTGTIIFVDRDPDCFEEILYFMRCNCIKPETNFNPFLLRMILAEAQFFAYDVLVDACEKQLTDLGNNAKKMYDNASKVTARSASYMIDERHNQKIRVKKNEVVYISSAVLAGRCQIRRYENKRKEENDEDNIEGCYLQTCERDEGDTGDFQLHYLVSNDEYDPYDEIVGGNCIAHVGLDQIHCGSIPTNIDFRQTIDTCISTEEWKYVYLSVTGSATWHVHCWIGLPEDIPVLNRGDASRDSIESTKKRRMIKSMISNITKKRKKESDGVAFLFAATAAAAAAAANMSMCSFQL